MKKPHKPEYLLAKEFVDALRYFSPKGDECQLCGICTNRRNCDYDDLRHCKKGIAEWIKKSHKVGGGTTYPTAALKSFYGANKG